MMSTEQAAAQPDPELKQNIQLAKKAYAEYLHLLHQLSDEEKITLDQEVKSLELQKIAQVQQYIQSLNVK